MIGEGDLTYRFDTGNRNDELESLASTFNQMAASILHREKQGLNNESYHVYKKILQESPLPCRIDISIMLFSTTA